MQNLKLFAFAILGAGLLGIHVTTSTGCEASAEATGGGAGSGDAGTSAAGTSAAGTSAAGTGGTDAAGSGGSDAAGSGGSGGSGPTSGASLAAALKADAACQACLDGMTGTVKDGAGADVACDGVVGKCDADQTCQDYIASIKTAGEEGADTDPNCWTEAAGVALNGGNGLTNELTACAVATCGDKCGNLSFAAPTGCD